MPFRASKGVVATILGLSSLHSAVFELQAFPASAASSASRAASARPSLPSARLRSVVDAAALDRDDACAQAGGAVAASLLQVAVAPRLTTGGIAVLGAESRSAEGAAAASATEEAPTAAGVEAPLEDEVALLQSNVSVTSGAVRAARAAALAVAATGPVEGDAEAAAEAAAESAAEAAERTAEAPIVEGARLGEEAFAEGDALVAAPVAGAAVEEEATFPAKTPPPAAIDADASAGAGAGVLAAAARLARGAAAGLLEAFGGSSSASAAGSRTDARQESPEYLEATGEGDVVQGLVFTTICLIIVLGIYLLVFNEYRPGESAYPMSFDQVPSRSFWQRPGSSMQAAAQKFSTKSLAIPDLRPSPFGMPGTPPTLPGTQATFANMNVPRTDDWYNELPMIYPQLVMPMAHTRLAVPLAMLGHTAFEVDVLGLSGVPLLSAVLSPSPKLRSIEISLHSVGSLVARVTAELEVLSADGKVIGTLKRDAAPLGMGEGPELVLRDREGRPILLLITTRKDAGGRDFKLSSVTDGVLKERATAVRRPAGRLPGEHYEVVANPNVDAVLVLAVLLAAVVFETPSPNLCAPPASGRPSTVAGYGGGVGGGGALGGSMGFPQGGGAGGSLIGLASLSNAAPGAQPPPAPSGSFAR